MHLRSILLSSSLCLTLVGCIATRDPLPKGTQIRHGVLSQMPLSLDRRGTHLLMSGSVKIAYVESSSVNLRLLEGHIGEFTGTFEENIQKYDLPVFVVITARSMGDDARSWTFPALGITMSTPLSWKGAFRDGVVTFSQTGSTAAYLTIQRQPYDQSPFAPKTATGSHSASSISATFSILSSFRIAKTTDLLHGITRITFDLGSSLSIPQESRTLLFTFHFPSSVTLTEQQRILELVEKSVRISSGMPSSASNTSRRARSSLAPSSSSGDPISACGGAAGILCPSGFYCSITDKKENIGKCVSR